MLATDAGDLRDGSSAAARRGRSGWAAAVGGMVRRAPSSPCCGSGSTGRSTPTRPAFLGTSGYGLLDNVSVLERFEAGAAAWAAGTGGSVVEVHAYALADADAVDGRRCASGCGPSSPGCTPRLRTPGGRASEWLLRDDCSLPVRTVPWADRPGVRTPDARVLLAGDGIRCELPVALMERAATTGMQAANALLPDWGTGRPRRVVGADARPARPRRPPLGPSAVQSGVSPRSRRSNRRSA